MPELTQQQFQDSVSDEADLAAVDRYLSVSDDPEKMLPLVADLMPKGRIATTDQALEEAVSLPDRLKGAAARLREELLSQMNYETLMALMYRIGYNHAMLSQDRHITGKGSPSGQPEIDDPVKGPVFAMIQRRLPGLGKAPELQRRLEIDAAIENASARTTVRYPGVSCDLEPALRWAANAPDVPFNTLKRAFKDYLITRVWSGERDSLGDELADCTEQLQLVKDNTSQSHQIRNQIKTIKKRLASIKEADSYRSSFKPGKTDHPRKLAARAREVFEEYDRPDSVGMKSTLAELATTFHPFWEKHATAYEKLAEKKSSSNRASGVRGPTSRVRAEWKRRTDEFVQFAKGRNIPEIGSDKWNSFFAEFAKTQPEKHRTQKKIASFMKTLLVRAAESVSDDGISDIIALLRCEKIKAVDSETIRSCLKKLEGVSLPSSDERSLSR